MFHHLINAIVCFIHIILTSGIQQIDEHLNFEIMSGVGDSFCESLTVRVVSFHHTWETSNTVDE